MKNIVFLIIQWKMSYVLVLRDRHAARSGVIDVLVVQNGVSSSGNVGNFFQVII